MITATSKIQDVATFTPKRVHRKFTCALCEQEKSGAGFGRDERGAYKAVCRKCEPSDLIFKEVTKPTTVAVADALREMIGSEDDQEVGELLKTALQNVLYADVKIQMRSI